MKNSKPTEKLMMRASRNESLHYAAAFKKVVEVFNFIDRLEHSNHCKIMSILYDGKHKNLTYEGVAARMHISDNALRRYRRNYAEWFKYYLEIERSDI